jgi:RNA polymerase sigma factor for flagellar operon FliA
MQARSVSTRQPAENWRETRDQIVVENLSLVKVIAVRVHENLPVHVDVEDLIHAGVLGLIDAVEKFDSAKNVVFQSYAKHRIKGAILDSLRQLDWASRDLRRRQKQLDALTRDLSEKLGRPPAEAEVARGMGVSVARWRTMSMALRTAGLAPLCGPRPSDQDRDRAEEFPAKPDLRPDLMCEREQLRNTLAKAIETLPVRYQKVVFLYYTNELTMKEIGDVLGVNESRVSQIHKTALKKMAMALGSEGIHSSQAF